MDFQEKDTVLITSLSISIILYQRSSGASYKTSFSSRCLVAVFQKIWGTVLQLLLATGMEKISLEGWKGQQAQYRQTLHCPDLLPRAYRIKNTKLSNTVSNIANLCFSPLCHSRMAESSRVDLYDSPSTRQPRLSTSDAKINNSNYPQSFKSPALRH